MEMNRLCDLALEYEAKRSLVDELDSQLKDAKAEKEEAEAKLIQAILYAEEENGIDSLTVTAGGRKYGVSKKSYYRIPATNTDEAYQILRDLSLGDLIKETVDQKTLSSVLRAKSEEYMSEHPDSNEEFGAEFEPLLAVIDKYDKTTLSRVKAK